MRLISACAILTALFCLSPLSAENASQVHSAQESRFSDDELLYHRWIHFSGIADDFFSLMEGGSDGDVSLQEYHEALACFFADLQQYRESSLITFATQQKVYEHDIFSDLFSVLESSLQFAGQKLQAGVQILPDGERLQLFKEYLTTQKEMVDFFYSLHSSTHLSGVIVTVMLCVFSLLILVGLFFVLSYIKRRAQVVELTKRVEEQRLVVRIQEDERRWLGAELHDTAVQDIKAMKLFLSQLESRVKDREISPILERLQVLGGDSLACLYRILHKLVPPELGDEDFKTVLLSLCSEFKRTSGMECVFYMAPGTRLSDLSGETRLQLYRVVQEALSNVERHSKATSCIISVREADNRIIMFITDDGIGLGEEDLARKPSEGGFGLRGMEARISIWAAASASAGTRRSRKSG